MKIKEHGIPNKCPDDCKFHDDIGRYGQSSICIRCPVFNCMGEYPLLQLSDYREDWLEEWINFFNDNEYIPQLNFTINNKEKTEDLK